MSVSAPLDALIIKVFENRGQDASVQSPSLQIHPVAGSSATPPHRDDAFFNQLVSLMDWRSQGLLTDIAFQSATQGLGLY